jgi:DNA-binding LacI/PurR family transcriptional regulator
VRGDLREKVISGEFAGMAFLPTVRRLAEAYEVTPRTVHRVLKSLQAEGLLVSEPRRGYRVAPGACDPARGCPLAFLDHRDNEAVHLDGMEPAYLAPFQAAAHRRGYSLLSVAVEAGDYSAVLRELESCRASGVVCSYVRPELVRATAESGMPTVVADWWFPGVPVDSVMQDNFEGGALAARELLRRGYRRIAWLGHVGKSPHDIARLAGARAELERAGAPLAPEFCINCDRFDAADSAREVFSGRRRPDAVLALWTDVAAAALRGAGALGLRPGRDYGMIGWAREDMYERYYRPAFGAEEVQPAVVWSAAQMADLALDRLAARRKNPEMPPVKMVVPVRLRTGSEEEAKER